MKRVLVYLALVTVLAGGIEAAMLLTNGPYVMFLMWAPAVAALLACKLTGKPIAELGWGWGQTRWQIWAWALPILYATAAYALVWVTGYGGFPNQQHLAREAAQLRVGSWPQWAQLGWIFAGHATGGFIQGCAYAMGEEIGWRGFLVPELSKRFGFTSTVFISGTVWLLYHVPLIVFGDYNGGTPAWFSLTCFTVLIYSGTAVFNWIRMRSGSLWTAVFLHASHNEIIQSVLTPLTRNTGKTPWAIDEFGVAVPAVSLLVAVFLWTRRGELQT